MTTAELEEIIGVKVERTWEFVLFGDRLFRREVDRTWSEYQ